MKSSNNKLITVILGAVIVLGTACLMNPKIFEFAVLLIAAVVALVAFVALVASYYNEKAIARAKRYDLHVASGKTPEDFKDSSFTSFFSRSKKS